MCIETHQFLNKGEKSLFGVTMKYKNYKEYLTEDEQPDTQNSANVIDTALDNSGLGLAIIRQSKTKDNDETSNYKVNGYVVKGFLLTEYSAMKDEGYSETDGNNKISRLCDEFAKLGGTIKTKGSINKDSTIAFDNFTIKITPIKINSAVDNTGVDRIYAVIKTE